MQNSTFFSSKEVSFLKSRILEKLAAVTCALCLAVGVLSGVVFARNDEPAEELPPEPEATFVVIDYVGNSDDSEEPENTPEIVETALPDAAREVSDNRTEIPFVVDGEPFGMLPIVNGTPYAPVCDFLSAAGLTASTDLSNGVYTVTADGIKICASDGDIYFTFNGRYLLAVDGVFVQSGQVCLPVEALAKCLGISVSWDRAAWQITASADGIDLLESGDTFYGETDVYWMSRVIYAEAGNQSLLGQIAVGNVVMNRVASDEFPGQDDVYDVIFAKNQFEVVINGMIYMEPSDSAVIAAKLALEGYDVTDNSTYFATFFFGEGYECVKWIGDHCFMVEA